MPKIDIIICRQASSLGAHRRSQPDSIQMDEAKLLHSEASIEMRFVQSTSHGMRRRVEVVESKFVSYLRVSTVEQSASGLGLGAQR